MPNKFVLTAQLRLAAPGNVRQIVNSINNQLKGIKVNVNVNVKNATAQTAQLSTTLNQASKSATKLNSDLEKLGANAASVIKRYGAFTLATTGFLSLTNAISSGIDEAIKFDRELVRLAQVTGRNLGSLRELSDEVSRLSKEFGVSSSQILNVSVTLAQAGLSIKDTKVALEAIAKTGVSATFGDINDTTEATIAIMQQFGIESKDLEKTLGSINAVSARFAVESEDITAAVRRAGGAFKAAGGNLDEFQALFTSVRQTTRESAETIATGFRTIFTRLQRVRTQNFLESLGIDLRDSENQFVGPLKAIQTLSEALKDIQGTDPRFAKIIEELGGFRQISKVIPLLTQFKVTQDALNTSLRGGSSLSEDAAISQQALSIQISKVKEEFLDLIRTISGNSFFKFLVTQTLDLTSSLIKLVKALEPVLPLLTTFAAIRVGAGAKKFATGFSSKFSGFASGGVVPGSGNGDTVPAMLTPGEFVIRKNAVKAIGIDKLSKINKFADGGLVEPRTKDELLQALSLRGITPSNTPALSKILGRPAEANVVNGLNKLLADSKAKESTQQRKQDRLSLTVPTSASSGLPRFGSVVINGQTQLAAGVQTTASEINKESKEAGAIIQRIVGTLDNVLVKGDVSRFKVNSSGSEAINEVINKGVSSAIDFSIAPRLLPKALNPSDSVPISKLLDSNAVGAIEGYLFEAMVRRISGSRAFLDGSDKVSSTFDFRGPEISSAFFEDASNLSRTPFVDAKRTANDVSILAKSIRQLDGEKAKFGVVKGFATGGDVAGSDTVPAMLTPGEFVINKKAANRIGLANLNRLNKADVKGFAKGGPVETIGNAVQNPVLLLGIGSFLAGLTGASKELSEFISFVSQTGLQFSLFNNAIKVAKSEIPSFIKDNSGVAEALFGIGPKTAKNRARQKFEDVTVESLVSGASTEDALKAGRAARRATLEDIVKENKSFEKLSKGFQVAGAIASVAGGLISSTASSEINKGVDSTQLAGFGGALSGAGLGAQVGAIFGPLGASVGAVAGSIIGYTRSIGEAQKQLSAVKFSKRLEELSTSIQRVEKGFISLDSGLIDAKNIVSESFTRFTSLAPNDRSDLLGQFGQNNQGLEQLFLKVAKTSGTFEEFDTKIGDVLSKFSILSKIPYEDLRKQIQAQIDAQNKVNNFAENSARVIKAEERSINRITAFSLAISKAAESTDKFDDKISLLTSFAAGGGFQPSIRDNSRFIQQSFSGKGNDSDFKALSSRLLGGFSEGSELVKEFSEITRTISLLPSILTKLKSANQLGSGFDIEDSFASSLGDSGVSSSVANALSVVLRDILGPENDITKVTQTNTFELVDKFAKTFEEQQSLLGEFAASQGAQQKRIIDAYKVYGDAQLKINSIQEKILANQESRIDLEDKVLNRQRSVSDVANNRNSRTQSLFGSSDVTTLVSNRDKAQKEIERLTNESQSAQLSLQPALQKQIQDEIVNLEKANRGLQELAESTEVLSKIEDELAKERARKELGNDIGSIAAFGNAEQKRELASQIILARRAQSFGIESISENDRGKVLDLLQKFGENQFPGAGGLTGNKLIEQLTLGAGVPFFGTTNKEKDLLNQANAEFANRESALKALQEGIKKSAADIGTVIAQQNERFLVELENVLTGRKLFDIDSNITDTINKLGDNRNQQKDVERARFLSGTRPTEANIGEFRGTADLLAQRKALIEERANIRNSSSQIFGFKPEQTDSFEKTVEKFIAFANKNGLNLTPEELAGAKRTKEVRLPGRVALQTFDPKATSLALEQIAANKFKEKESSINSELDKNESLISLGNIITDIGNVDINSVSSIDSFVNTVGSINPQGISQLNSEFQRLKITLNSLTGLRDVEQQKLVPIKRAFGGPIPGSGNTDTVPAMLTPGEFVIRKSAVNAIGLDNLYALNSQGFAVGGQVGESEEERKRRLALTSRSRAFEQFVNDENNKVRSDKSRAPSEIASLEIEASISRLQGAEFDKKLRAKESLQDQKAAVASSLRSRNQDSLNRGIRLGRTEAFLDRQEASLPKGNVNRFRLSGSTRLASGDSLGSFGANQLKLGRAARLQPSTPVQAQAERGGTSELAAPGSSARKDFGKLAAPGSSAAKIGLGSIDRDRAASARAKLNERLRLRKEGIETSTINDAPNIDSFLRSVKRQNLSQISGAEAATKFTRKKFPAGGNTVSVTPGFLPSNNDPLGRVSTKKPDVPTKGLGRASGNGGAKSGSRSIFLRQAEEISRLLNNNNEKSNRKIAAIIASIAKKSTLDRTILTSKKDANGFFGSPLPDDKIEKLKKLGYNKGGLVNKSGSSLKRASGGPIPNSSSVSIEGMSELRSVVSEFSKSIEKFSSALSSIPTSIELSATHKVEVIFNGAEILTGLQPEIQKIAMQEAKKAINNMIDSKMSDIGRVV